MRKEHVAIVTPCGVEWNSLTRKGNARFCGECNKLVHDLSSMNEATARTLLGTANENLCVRYLYDATGQIHFAQPPVVPRGRLAWRKVARAAALTAPILFQACGGADAGPFRSDFDDFCTPAAPQPTPADGDGGVPQVPSGAALEPCPTPEPTFAPESSTAGSSAQSSTEDHEE